MQKTAIVTGASRGIGRAIAIRLSRDGIRVVLCARDAEALRQNVAEIARLGGSAASIALDLREPTSGAALVDFTIQSFERIDILINNAGATKRGPFEELTAGDWSDGFALKFFGAVRVTHAAWPALKSSGGSVVNIAGTGGRTPGAEFAIGGSVNAALLSLTKSLADTGVRDGVQVNAINPGFIRTDRFSKRQEAMAAAQGITLAQAEKQMVEESKTTRVGEPEDVANLATYIVSPAGRLLHGALIDLDGGATKTI